MPAPAPTIAVLSLLGAITIALGGVIAAFDGRLRAGLAIQAGGTALLGSAGAAALFANRSAGAGFRSGVSPALGLDPLSGFFLALLALTAVPTLIYMGAYLRSRTVGALSAAFLLALAGVLAARDVTAFLAGWELMTLLPAAAILAARRDAAVRSAVQAYVAITHLGGAGVWIALLALSEHGALGGARPLAAGTQALVAVAALIGFGTKAGLVPLHTWLPRAHPIAPAPLSALMSGLMVKVALYGLIRVEFEWIGAPPRWLGAVLLGVGLLSALGGALWALVQPDLKRLLAYSTIENVGIAVLGLGASLLLSGPWAALAFAAALLHIANHAVFKTLLFLAAGAFERATGGLDLDRLGGLARRMPWTAGAFGVGCVAIAGLPPLNGFASEWLTLQALAHLAYDGALGFGLGGAVALAGLAATAALALLCFAGVAGLVLLGPPRTEACATAVEAPLAMRSAMVALAAVCVVGGLVPTLLVPVLAELAPGPTPHGLPGTGGLPAPALAVALIALTALLVRARGRRVAAPAPTWACGQPVVAELNWTAAAFTKPLRLVLEVVLRPQRSLEPTPGGGLRYGRMLHPPVDRLLYAPVIRGALRGAAMARRLQTGNVRTYAAYLLALVVGLLALVRSGALG